MGKLSGRWLAPLVALCALAITPGEGVAGQEGRSMTGLFLILADAASADDLPEPTTEQQIARYDSKFLREEERRPPRYFLLAKRPDVPLLLAGPPQAIVGERGFTELLIELTEEAGDELERVTRENLGGAAAFVIDGEVITAHKIGSVIKNGRFQLSRCNDNACEFILARLAKR